MRDFFRDNISKIKETKKALSEDAWLPSAAPRPSLRDIRTSYAHKAIIPLSCSVWADERKLKHPALDIAEKWQANPADTDETIQQAL